MHNRIGIVAKMGSGKTTFANMLVNQGYSRFALADEVKDRVFEMLQYDGLGDLTRKEFDEFKPVFRPFLQWFGTEYVREFLGLNYFWIHTFLDKIEEAERQARTTLRVVCDDVRFENEVETLKHEGFFIVKLVRDEEERLNSLLTNLKTQGLTDKQAQVRLESMLQHPSEEEVDNIKADLIVINDTLDNLSAVADYLSS